MRKPEIRSWLGFLPRPFWMTRTAGKIYKAIKSLMMQLGIASHRSTSSGTVRLSYQPSLVISNCLKPRIEFTNTNEIRTPPW